LYILFNLPSIFNSPLSPLPPSISFKAQEFTRATIESCDHCLVSLSRVFSYRRPLFASIFLFLPPTSVLLSYSPYASRYSPPAAAALLSRFASGEVQIGGTGFYWRVFYSTDNGRRTGFMCCFFGCGPSRAPARSMTSRCEPCTITVR
jgi:hypothetical protein